MPELPDIVVYIEAIETRVIGQILECVRLSNPFLLRTAEPALSEVEGRVVRSLRRVGKRIVFIFDDELFLVLHLMIAGRLHWRETGAKLGGKNSLASFDFPTGSLVLTEAGSKRRASLYLIKGEAELERLDPGGIDVMRSSLKQFSDALRSENHTLKRSLTDPRLFSGIGNAYSDEILFAAALSPMMLTQRMSDEEIQRLFEATKQTLESWTNRLRTEAAISFPEHVTAFRKEMAVHGRFSQPCLVCTSPIQRIRYADNETNYCARCQTGGRLLSDRAFSRLLGSDWPKTLDGLELLSLKNKTSAR